MQRNIHLNSPLKKEGLLIPHLYLPGQVQMALDLMLLEKSINENSICPILRFYTWEGNYLSIGKNQKNLPKKWQALLKSKRLQIVRRPSGGSAVLHKGGLTYSLIWPSPPKKRRESYFLTSKWLINGFTKLGLELKFGSQSQQYLEKNCFNTSTSADLIDKQGNKRIGSAQFWCQNYLLQHGEIILDPPKDLWLDVFECDPPEAAPKSIHRSELEKVLINEMKSYWPHIRWKHREITGNELVVLEKHAPNYLLKSNDSYFSTIPDEIIDSTT